MINKRRATFTFIRKAAIALIIIACGANSFRAADVGDFLGRRVTSVEVVAEGVPGGTMAGIESGLEITVGQDYSPVRIHDALVRLYQSGLISSGRVEGTAVGADGVALRFIVRPQARIDNVIFEGDTVFPATELRARLNELDPGDKLTAGPVARGLAELQAFYSSRGYYQAEITSEVRLDPTGTRATVVYTVTPGQQARVSRYALNINGAQVDLSKIKHAVVEGQPFRQPDVQDEVERIRQAYLQQDYLAVRVNSAITPDPAANAVAVTVTVDSGPKVRVEVQGLELSDKRKREVLPFYTQGGIDDFTLEEGRRRLQDYAQRQGYFFAEVTKPNTPDLSAPVATLNYIVDTGQRYRLANIEIEGVDAIPHQTLEDEMKSREASFIPLFGLNRGITSNDMLRQDSNLILKRLREIGYRRAQVEVRRGVSLTGGDLIITFDVRQGPRSYIDEIGIRGNKVLTTDQLRESLTVELNDPLVSSEVGQNADRLLAAYTTRGYANAEVLSEVVDVGNFDGRDHVRLLFNVSEGNRVRIANVNTRGTGITNVTRLERDFYLFEEGEWLRTDMFQETERELYDTNAFNTVTITSEPVGRTVDGIEEHNVTVDLAEAKRHLLIYGFGYQTNRSALTVPGLEFLNGARGLVQLTNTNMFGRVYTGSAQFRVSQNELLGTVSFQNPRPFGTKWPTLISIFARRLAETSFRSDRYTALIQSERRLSPQSILYFSYNFERIGLYDLQVSAEEIERNRQAIRLGRIGPSYARDTRDNASDPMRGTLTLGSFFFASKFLGGNEQFIKMLVEHSRYYPITRFRETVYSVSGRLGLATPFGGDDSLPISERFFGGGARDLRGFGFEEAGPRDPNTNRPIGGNAVFVINNELRFPIYSILGGTVFSDTGNVFRRVRDIRPGNFTQTLGFGLRIKTPIGPVRFDVGFLVLNKPEGAPGFRRHFTLGQTF